MPAKKKKEGIKWRLIEVKRSDIKPNPENPKIRNNRGMSRLEKSLDAFGVVFDGICNKDLMFIDGHSRLELTDNETLSVFVPERQLTPNEYKLMCAVYDHAKAGDLDVQYVEERFTEEEMEYYDMSEEKEDEIDYSSRNKEIDVDDFEDEMVIKLKYTEDEYRAVKDKLLKIAPTMEQAVWLLLKLDDE